MNITFDTNVWEPMVNEEKTSPYRNQKQDS